MLNSLKKLYSSYPGERRIDVEFEWEKEGKKKYPQPICVYKKFLTNILKTKPIHTNFFLSPQITNLTCEQKVAYDFVVKKLSLNEHFLALIQGSAGASKSVVYLNIMTYLQTNKIKFVSATSTGIAATYLHSFTIHHTFQINPLLNFEMNYKMDISSKTRDRLCKVKIILIDETYFMGKNILAIINKRMQQANTTDKIFGGASILLTGDLFQLRCVGDVPLYSCRHPESQIELEGDELYKSIKNVFLFTCNMRFSEDTRFEKVLLDFRNQSWQTDAIQILNSRHESFLSAEEIDRFSDAKVLAFFKKDVRHFNESKLEQMGIPLCRVPQYSMMMMMEGVNTLDTVLIGNEIDAILTTNVSVQHGLANGSPIRIKSILFDESERPACLMVRVETYRGPNLLHPDNTIPIFPIANKFREADGKMKSFRAFPVTTTFSMTYYRCQGQTLPKVKIFVRKPISHEGLYVALSRVTKLNDFLLLGEKLSIDMFRSCSIQEKIKEYIRLQTLFNANIIT